MWRKLSIFLVSVVLGSASGAPARAASAPLAWPVEGEVITPYRNGADPYAAGMHRGIDIAAAVGTRVRAALSGTASFAGRAPDGALDVTIRSRDGVYLVSHVHLASIAVHRGDAVTAGETIGTVGRTGRPASAQPHLHLGVRQAATRAYVDPLPLLPPVAVQPPPGAPSTPGTANLAAPVPAARPVEATSVRAVMRSVQRARGERSSRARPGVRGRQRTAVPVVTPHAVRSQAATPQRRGKRSGTATTAGIRAPGLGQTATSKSSRPRETLATRAAQAPAASLARPFQARARPVSQRDAARGRPGTLGLLAIAALAAVLLWRRRSVANPTPRPVTPFRAVASERREQRA